MNPYFFVIPFIVLLSSMAIAIYFDIFTREVNSFIFIPSLVVGSTFSFLAGVPYFIVATWTGILICSFIPSNSILYPVAGILYFVIAVTLFFSNALFLFDSIIIGILFFLGTREKYFGIADVKALIVTAISFPFAAGLGYPVLSLLSNIEIPVPFLLIFNSSIAGLLFVPYLFILNMRKKNKFGIYWIYSLAFDKKEYSEKPFKYRLSTFENSQIMVYKSPFMVAIFVSMVVAILFGI